MRNLLRKMHLLTLSAITAIAAYPSPTDWLPDTINIDDGANIVRIAEADYVVEGREGKALKVRRPLFDPIYRMVFDGDMLDYIEEAYAWHTFGQNNDRFAGIRFVEGSWADVDKVDSATPFELSHEFSQSATLSWYAPDGTITISFPTDYLLIKGGSRSEIENRFISNLADCKVDTERPKPLFAINDLDSISSELLCLKGAHYVMPGVNRNTYIVPDRDGNLDYVFDAAYPLSTMSNLVIMGDESFDPVVDLVVLKHKIGDTETLSVPLEALMQHGDRDGCIAYWSTLSYEDNILRGVLFLYNQYEGYDHIIRLECDTRDMTNKNFPIKGTASLYVPTNNVYDLFEQEKIKTDNERIRYR